MKSMSKATLKNGFIFLNLIVLLSTLPACVDGKSSKTPNNDTTNPAVPTEELSECKPADESVRPILYSKDISISREYQRTIRYNCDGSIKSDEIETVVSPHGGDQIIKPKIAANNRRAKYKGQWKIINRTLCEGRTSYRFNDNDMYEAILFLDMAPGFFSFQVTDGENFIDYDFYACSKVDETEHCIEKEMIESGTVKFNIAYTEITRPTSRVIHPTVEQCQSKPKDEK